MDQNAEALLHLEGVKKVFFTEEVETHALSGIHLKIQPGEFLAIAGPSGCGKSTLLSIIGLLDSPTDGEFWLKQEQVANLTVRDRARIRNREIGFIFQAFNLIGDLTVYDRDLLTLLYDPRIAPGMTRAQARSVLPKVIDDLHLAYARRR